MKPPRPRKPTADVARALFVARSLAHLTQKELATRAGVGVRSIRRWEAGHGAPTPSSLVALLREIERVDADVAAKFRARVAIDATTDAPKGDGVASRVGSSAARLGVAPELLRDHMRDLLLQLKADGVSVDAAITALQPTLDSRRSSPP
jgi:transcriptional regulator with XRE-family HTH domain